MLSTNKFNIALAVLSVCLVIYAEWIYPAKAFDQCHWPLGPNARHVAIIADPQIIDDHTYPGRNRFLGWITEAVTDRFLARNFRLLHSKLKPDTVVFLGDLFDGGREWENAAWEQEFKRYRKVFPLSKEVNHIENLPGNHDVGSADDIIPHSFERFQKYFGKANQIYTISDHNLVTLDTNSLMNEVRDDIRQPAKAMLNKLKEKQRKLEPIIIFSHIPFYRPDGGYCGFERETKPFSWMQGKQYITELTPDLTNDILQGVKPVYVFSGDDHDACKYTHRWGTDGVTEEHTVKSFSMAMGIQRPGFQVLSLDINKSHMTDTCLTAKPFVPFILQGVGYAVMALSALFIAFKRKANKFIDPLPLPANSGDDKEAKRNHQNGSLSSSSTREALKSILTLLVSWVFAQTLIHIWSYKQNI